MSDSSNDKGIGWVVSRLIPSHHHTRSLSNTAKWMHHEFKVKYCTSCLNAWDYNSNQFKYFDIYYYQDFPTYKLKEEKCHICDTDKYKGNKKVRVII